MGGSKSLAYGVQRCWYRIALVACICLPQGAAQVRGETFAKLDAQLQAGEPTRIVCFGDSITGAYYHTGGQRAWCEMLGVALERLYPNARLTMINAGISGHTTENALARIHTDVLSKQPHLVVVMFGMNDVTRVPENMYRVNLETIVAKLQGVGSEVILCTPNSVYDNAARPNEKLAVYGEIVKQVAAERSAVLIDIFAHWQTLRSDNEREWQLLMSDEIHPNMNGHREFARVIAERIAGRPFQWEPLPAVPPTMPHTLAKLERGSKIKLVTMAPYDTLVPVVLRQRFPQAEVEVVVWPEGSRSIAEMRQWAEQIRGLQPDLVMPTVPVDIAAANEAEFIQNFEWVLNYSFPFEGRAWDVVPILPSVTDPDAAARSPYAAALRTIVIGKDVAFVEPAASEPGSPEQILAEFFRASQAAENDR